MDGRGGDNEGEVMRLVRYVKCSRYDVEDLVQRKVTLAAPRLFNDPNEVYYYNCEDSVLDGVKGVLKNEYIDRMRIACFVRENKVEKTEKFLMWTHYARRL